MHSKSEQQIAEKSTIKERTIKLKLSDADVYRVAIKAAKSGISVETLLENFIGDLVDGTYSNGSDERDLAGRWFSRCWFGCFPKKSLLQHLANHDFIDSALYAWKELQDISTEISEMESDENLEYLNACLEDERHWQEEVSFYVEGYGNPSVSAWEEVCEWDKKVLNWIREGTTSEEQNDHP